MENSCDDAETWNVMVLSFSPPPEPNAAKSRMHIPSDKKKRREEKREMRKMFENVSAMAVETDVQQNKIY